MSGSTLRVSLPAGYEIPLYFWPNSNTTPEQTIVCTTGQAFFLHGSIPLVQNKGYHVQSVSYSYASEGSGSGDSVSETIAEVSGLMRWANGGLVASWEKLYADRRVALSAATGVTDCDPSRPLVVVVSAGSVGCELLVAGCASDNPFQEPRIADSSLSSIFDSVSQYRQRCVDHVLRQEGLLEGGNIAAAPLSPPPTQKGGSSPSPTSGPVVVVIGGRSSGKTALANQLVHSCQLNCIARESAGLDDTPVQAALLSTDVRGGIDSDLLPGCISARFTCLPGSSQPLSYCFGATAVRSEDVNRYLDVCAYASQSLEMLRLSKKEIRLGGTIVDTLAITDTPSYRAVTGLLDLIRPTHIVVLSAHTEVGHQSSSSLSTPFNEDSNVDWSSKSIISRLHRDVLGIQMGHVKLMSYRQRYPTAALTPAVLSSSCPPSVLGSSTGFDSYFSGRPIEVASGEAARGVMFNVGLRMPLAASLQVVRLADLLLLDALTFERIAINATVTTTKRRTEGDDEEEGDDEGNSTRRLVPGMVAAVPFPCAFDALTATNIAGHVAIKEIGEEMVILVCPAPGPLPTKVLLVSSFTNPVTVSETVTAALSW